MKALLLEGRDPRCMIALFWIVLGSVIVAAPALAQAPTGFAGLPWGTRSDAVHDYIYAERLCVFVRLDVESAHCDHYELPGVGDGKVLFWSLPSTEADASVSDGTLAGYSILLPFSSYPAFRRLVVDKFGPPHRTERRTYTTATGAVLSGDVLLWGWAGVSASLSERCTKLTELCLSVTTAPLDARRAGQGQHDREKAKKSF